MTKKPLLLSLFVEAFSSLTCRETRTREVHVHWIRMRLLVFAHLTEPAGISMSPPTWRGDRAALQAPFPQGDPPSLPFCSHPSVPSSAPTGQGRTPPAQGDIQPCLFLKSQLKGAGPQRLWSPPARLLINCSPAYRSPVSTLFSTQWGINAGGP